MDETTKTIIESITVRFPVPTKIHSGHNCKVFYDCFQLSPNELARLAAQAVGHLKPDEFDIAVGLAYSGILFASAIAGGRKVAIIQKDSALFGPSVAGRKVVLVDDVVNSGSRLVRGTRILEQAGADIVGYACIVDRSAGKLNTTGKPAWSAYQTEME